MNRRRFLKLAGLSLIGSHASSPVWAQRTHSKPNVVLIMADDLGYECLSCYGSSSYSTPNLDELARGGARFIHCYSQPLCTPTRVQIMTGRYNFRNYSQFGKLNQEEKTFGHMMKQAGYKTCVAGKWQLHADGGQSPDQVGFDEFCLWALAYKGEVALGHRYADANLIVHDHETDRAKLNKFTGKYGPDICTEYICDFVKRSVVQSQPFFVYYAMILTHNPFKPIPDSPEWKSGDRHQTHAKFFGGMVEYMDRLVGRIVSALNQLGILENTLILFTGDNGTNGSIRSSMQDGRQIRGEKGYHTDGGTRVPLIAYWKGTILPSQVRNELVDTTDFLPTISDATHAEIPTPPGDGIIDGMSFLPHLTGRSGKAREWVFVGYTEKRQDSFGWPRARFVRNQRYKLYDTYIRRQKKGDRVIEDRSGHMYDLEKDPLEEHPILPGAEGDALRSIREKFQTVLKTHR